ncbi:hypothetical protein AB0L70_04510 [Kribbella sp. NPDC051952]|uniref:hypothetical protein n=1 Tax=Kribbella sp. NPDC051952 TaxID=3154851 RepID=UPI0034476CBC
MPTDNVPLDVTGTWDQQVQIDAIADVLRGAPANDGGLSWDAESRTIVVRLVGPVDGSSPAVEQLKASVLELAEEFTVTFESVEYSRAELQELATRLFERLGSRALGIGGGWDCYANRVMVVVALGTDDTQDRLGAIRSFDDDRIVVRTYTPVPGDLERRRPVGPRRSEFGAD